MHLRAILLLAEAHVGNRQLVADLLLELRGQLNALLLADLAQTFQLLSRRATVSGLQQVFG